MELPVVQEGGGGEVEAEPRFPLICPQGRLCQGKGNDRLGEHTWTVGSGV